MPLRVATVASVILRCTARLLDLLDMRDVARVEDAASDEDWYANVLWIDRRKCLLLTHAGTLFPIFAADVRKRDLRPPGPFVVDLVHAALGQEHLPVDALGALDPDALGLARTASRRILGFMNDTALMSRRIIDQAGGLQHVALDALNHSLRRTLHNRDRLLPATGAGRRTPAIPVAHPRQADAIRPRDSVRSSPVSVDRG